MADRAQLLAEAYRRGLLPPDKKAAYEEAARRGIVKDPYVTARRKAQTLSDTADRQSFDKGFTTQVVRNLGVEDEMAGAANFLFQGAENIGRRIAGKPIEVPARVAYEAGSDVSRAEAAKYKRQNPIKSKLATGAGFVAAGVPRGVVAGGAMAVGAQAAAANAPFALGRQDGGLVERLPGAAMETAATFALGAGGQKLASGLARVGGKKAPSPKRVARAETVARFDRAGVDPTLAAVEGGAASRIANAVAENPIGFRQRAQLSRSIDQAGDSAQRLAGEFGQARGRQAAGEAVQEGVTRFAKDPDAIGSFKARSSKLYDDAFDAIERGAAASGARPQVAETLGTLQQVQSRAGGSIGQLINDPQIARIAQAVQDDAGRLSFGDLRALRTWVREAKGNPQLRQGIDDAALAALEGALSRDIAASAVTLAGPQAAARLRRADQFYRAGSERINKALQPFASARSGESAYAKILQSAGSTSSADAQRLVSLKRSVSRDEWGDIASQVVSEMGKPSKGATGAIDGGFSVNTFVSNYNGLSERGKDALFGSLGGGGARRSALRGELDNLARVADKLKAVEKGANASNTGTAMQQLGTIGGVAGLGVVPAAKVLAGVALTGEVMTNPAFVRWLARIPTQGSRQTWQTYVGRLADMASRDPAIGMVYHSLQEQMALAPGR